ncbi:hypothetical protein HOC35_04040 [Candidatus Woesearchaeota archaeon]|jgi:hypothetical protein|nr:hypothetical protein [Candidatus Woesearchaeota archaeon]
MMTGNMDALDLLVASSRENKSEKPQIKRAIVSFSYDRKLEFDEACKKAQDKAALEEKLQKPGRSHVFYRTLDYKFDGEEVDFVKFNLLIGDVPGVVYTYLNVMLSDLEEVSFVVSPLSKEILNECRKIYGDFGKTIHVTDELDPDQSWTDLSFFNSFADKGIRPFKDLGEDEQFLLIPGDMPFTDQETINDIIYDKRNKGHDVILNFNYFYNMFFGLDVVYPRRNTHYHILNPDGTINSGKESNLVVMNSRILPYIGHFTDSRKNGGVINASIDLILDGKEVISENYNEGNSRKLKDMTWSEWKTLFSRLRLAAKGNMRAVKSILFNKMVKDPRSKKQLVFDISHLNKLAYVLAELNPLFRFYTPGSDPENKYPNMVAHHDFSRVNDLDAPQDYVGFLGPLRYCADKGWNLGQIYRNAGLLNDFLPAMARLRADHLFFAEHNAIVNDTSRGLGLDKDVFNGNDLNLQIYKKHQYPGILRQLHRYVIRKHVL